MRIGFHGELLDAPAARIGYIGCGSHSRRNVLPALKFASAQLVAICDLDLPRAQAFAQEFGFTAAYSDYREMLSREALDAVCIVVGYDKDGRPLYPRIALDCLRAGVHVWTEKPPAATSAELVEIARVCEETGKQFVVGLKKMFFPANVKAKELSQTPEFGGIAAATLCYPQYVPTREEFERFRAGENVGRVVGFLDHLCHPASLMLYLMGAPETLYYTRSPSGAGLATFTFADGACANMALTHRAAGNGGMERTVLIANKRGHITVDNNVRVSYHRDPPGLDYGGSPSYYAGDAMGATSVWEPEFSLGQLYNKGLFLLGYYGELEAFAQSVLAGTPIDRAGVRDAICVTRIFEAFMQGEQKIIRI